MVFFVDCGPKIKNSKGIQNEPNNNYATNGCTTWFLVDINWLMAMMTSSNGNIFRSPVNSPHKGQWRGALMFSLICVSINSWVNNRQAGDLRRYHAHYDVNVMLCWDLVYMIHKTLVMIKLAWWLLMSWCQLDAETSATIRLIWVFIHIRIAASSLQQPHSNC